MIYNVTDVIETISKDIIKDKKDIQKEVSICIIRVIGDEASKVYVRNKQKKCEEFGIKSIILEYPNDITNEEIKKVIEECNNDTSIDGILLQLPLPKHLNEEYLINKIKPEKDIDCLTTANVGKLFSGYNNIPKPCTAIGVLETIKDFSKKHFDTLEGKHVVIINRSMLVGKPLVQMLQNENMTVTLLHSKANKNLLNKELELADFIVTATGQVDFINKDKLSELNKISKKLILDVSMNRNKDNKLCGDVSKVDHEDLTNIYVTPVPKGLGQLTVLSLIKNTITCAKK